MKRNSFFTFGSLVAIGFGLAAAQKNFNLLKLNPAVETSRREYSLAMAETVRKALFQKSSKTADIKFVRTVLENRSRNLWLADESGLIFAASTPSDFPCEWAELNLPDQEKDYNETHSSAGQFLATALLISEKPRFYLVVGTDPLVDQSWIDQLKQWAVPVAGISLFIISALFLMLLSKFQSKAKQLRRLIAQLKGGDIEARLQISEFDEAAELLPEINHLIDELGIGRKTNIHYVENTNAVKKVTYPKAPKEAAFFAESSLKLTPFEEG